MLSPLLYIIFMGNCMREARIGEGGEETFVYAENEAMVADAVVLQNIVDM